MAKISLPKNWRTGDISIPDLKAEMRRHLGPRSTLLLMGTPLGNFWCACVFDSDADEMETRPSVNSDGSVDFNAAPTPVECRRMRVVTAARADCLDRIAHYLRTGAAEAQLRTGALIPICGDGSRRKHWTGFQTHAGKFVSWGQFLANAATM